MSSREKLSFGDLDVPGPTQAKSECGGFTMPIPAISFHPGFQGPLEPNMFPKIIARAPREEPREGPSPMRMHLLDLPRSLGQVIRPIVS